MNQFVADSVVAGPNARQGRAKISRQIAPLVTGFFVGAAWRGRVIRRQYEKRQLRRKAERSAEASPWLTRHEDWTPRRSTTATRRSASSGGSSDALLRGAFNRTMQQISDMARADDGVGASALPPEKLPPRLAADEQPIPQRLLSRPIEMVEAKLDELAVRHGQA